MGLRPASTKKKRRHADTTVPHIPADPKDIMAALGRTPPLLSGDELAERLKQQTAARVKESRQLLDAAKQKLKKTGKGGWRVFWGATD
jgi:hypothetical protein